MGNGRKASSGFEKYLNTTIISPFRLVFPVNDEIFVKRITKLNAEFELFEASKNYSNSVR